MRLWRSGPVRVWAVIAGVATVFQLAWVADYGVYLIPALAIDDVSATDALRSSIGRQEVLFRDAIGNLHGGGASRPVRRSRCGSLRSVRSRSSPCSGPLGASPLSCLGIALACIVLPRRPRSPGLPRSGAPVLAGALTRCRSRSGSRSSPACSSLACCRGFPHVSSDGWPPSSRARSRSRRGSPFANDGHRLTVGIGGPLMPWSEVWSPPVPLTVLDLAYLLLLGVLVLLVVRPSANGCPARSLNQQMSPATNRRRPRSRRRPSGDAAGDGARSSAQCLREHPGAVGPREPHRTLRCEVDAGSAKLVDTFHAVQDLAVATEDPVKIEEPHAGRTVANRPRTASLTCSTRGSRERATPFVGGPRSDRLP